MRTQESHSPLSRFFIPGKWSLGTRLFFTTGVLLVFGAALTLFTVSYYQTITSRESINTRILDYSQLFEHQSKELLSNISTSAASLSVNDEITSAMEDDNSLGLQLSVAKIKDKILLSTGKQPEALQFYSPEIEPLFHSRGLNKLGDPSRTIFDMVKRVEKSNSPLSGIQVLTSGPVLSSITPAMRNGQLVGFIEATSTYEELFAILNLSDHFGIALLLNQAKTTEPQATASNHEPEIIKFGTTDIAAYMKKQPLQKGVIGSYKTTFFKETALVDYSGKEAGRLILFYNAVEELEKLYATIKIMGWMTLIGIVIVLASLYYNISRILLFLKQLNRAITYSVTNDYKQPFLTDNITCCEVFDCDPLECPVGKDSSKICYMEVGHRAILPDRRNSCSLLEKFKSCKHCPVYKNRQGDELTEIRLSLSSLTSIWEQFLAQAGNLFSGVFRSGNDKVPSLTQVARYLQQMAGLSTFGHDMQGVYSKDEVYRQLQWVFEKQFELSNFNLLEVNASENRMKSVINLADLSGSHMDVMVDCELCRSKRVAEVISSENNPHLCPYFDIDHEQEVRCCLPMVMGGRVGAVFTFVSQRSEWKQKKKNLPIMMKYLDETAPTLASLRLIQISREQALRDPLTKCHNRRFMDEYLVQLEGLNSRSPRNVGFIMADLDHFKMVNDEFGHLAGDEILKQVAEILKNNIRKTDLLIRYGGEEFLIVLMEMNDNGEAYQIAEKLRTAVEAAKLALPTGGSINKTISMGVAEFPTDAEYLYKAIKYADVALYQAKDQGRNKVLSFQPDMWQEDDY